MTDPHPKITISAVSWNSASDLPRFFESLKNQTRKDFHFIFVDNNSTDDSVTLARQYLLHAPFSYEIIENNENLGYSGGHNTALARAQTPWALITNLDIWFPPNFIENVYQAIERHPEMGACTFKLYRDDEQTLLDQAGISIFRSRQMINRGEAAFDRGQYDREEEVFAAAGACMAVSIDALRTVSQDHEYFDQDFFAYKEEIDLCWRLRQFGYGIWYIPSVTAVHYRAARRAIPGHRALSTIRNRRLKNIKTRNWSYRNHWWLIVKNDSALLLFLHSPWFLYYELQKILFILLFEQQTLRVLPAMVRGIPKMRAKRRWIKSHRKQSTLALRRWFQ